MDKILHFIVSLGLTVFILMLGSAFIPKGRRKGSRFWVAEQTVRNIFFTSVFAFSFLIVLTFGLWKEWFDALGLGSVQFSDVLADILGIWVGVYIVLVRMRNEFRRRRRVEYTSHLRTRNSSAVNLFRNAIDESLPPQHFNLDQEQPTFKQPGDPD